MHDFTKQILHGLIRQRTVIPGFQVGQELPLARGSENRLSLFFLNGADVLDEPRAPGQKLQKRIINAVNMGAQFFE